MSRAPDTARRLSSRRPAVVKLACPACHAPVRTGDTHCPACRFTGGDSMAKFPGTPPPLLPILDVADMWNLADVRQIEAARAAVEKRFPQFRWRFCAVDLPPATPLPLFGFWLMNASPLVPPESAADRAWTVLLLVNRSNGHAAAVPGYAAETWVTDLGWQDALIAMRTPWRAGESGKAVADFLTAAARILEQEWKISSRT